MKLHDMPEDWYRSCRICQALSNPKTYSIVRLLASGRRMTPSELSAKLNRNLRTISGHLRTLRYLDLVRYQRQGREAIYWLKDPNIGRILDELESYIRKVRKMK